MTLNNPWDKDGPTIVKCNWSIQILNNDQRKIKTPVTHKSYIY